MLRHSLKPAPSSCWQHAMPLRSPLPWLLRLVLCPPPQHRFTDVLLAKTGLSGTLAILAEIDKFTLQQNHWSHLHCTTAFGPKAVWLESLVCVPGRSPRWPSWRASGPSGLHGCLVSCHHSQAWGWPHTPWATTAASDELAAITPGWLGRTPGRTSTFTRKALSWIVSQTMSPAWSPQNPAVWAAICQSQAGSPASLAAGKPKPQWPTRLRRKSAENSLERFSSW